jgi:ATP-dependent RNA helicase DDX1
LHFPAGDGSGGGAAFRGKRESGKEHPYSCVVLAGARSMEERRTALQVRVGARLPELGWLGGKSGSRDEPSSTTAEYHLPEPSACPPACLAFLQAFKEGDVRFLICTDVAARGIDIQVWFC